MFSVLMHESPLGVKCFIKHYLKKKKKMSNHQRYLEGSGCHRGQLSSPSSLEVSNLGLKRLVPGRLWNRTDYGTEKSQFLGVALKEPSHYSGDYFCQFYFGVI